MTEKAVFAVWVDVETQKTRIKMSCPDFFVQGLLNILKYQVGELEKTKKKIKGGDDE